MSDETAIGKLWTALTELSSDYWGPNKNNGTRSIVREHEKRLDGLEQWRSHYLDADRAKSCPYLHDKKLSKEDDVSIRVEQIRAKAQMRMQVLILIGVVASAIITLLK